MVSSWLVVQSTWLERERESSFFQRERAFKGERERNSRGRSIQECEEKLREGGEVCPGYLISAF